MSILQIVLKKINLVYIPDDFQTTKGNFEEDCKQFNEK